MQTGPDGRKIRSWEAGDQAPGFAVTRFLPVLVWVGMLGGCASPGPPRPPSLALPQPVKDLSAERVGNRVLLRWTTPSRTTDDLDIKGGLSAAICRSEGPPSASSKKDISGCSLALKVPVVSGASSAWDDLPSPLLAGAAKLLAYRVEILNAAGRSAGPSTVVAYAAAGAAPGEVESLRAVPSESGALLQWKKSPETDATAVDLIRVDLSAPDAPQRKTAVKAPIPGRRGRSAAPANSAQDASNEVRLRVSASAAENAGGDGWAGTVDATAMMGETYSYRAQRVRVVTLAGHALEARGAQTPVVTLAMRDTFPPRPPTGLATVPGESAPGTSYIDLSWEPNTEPDLAGYLVYRQLARPDGDPQGPLGKLTPLPIAAPAYRDVAVRAGQRYIYSVTAVDASGNESAPSAKAQEVAAAQNVVGSPP